MLCRHLHRDKFRTIVTNFFEPIACRFQCTKIIQGIIIIWIVLIKILLVFELPIDNSYSHLTFKGIPPTLVIPISDGVFFGADHAIGKIKVF